MIKKGEGKELALSCPSRAGRRTKCPLSLESPQIVDYVARFSAAQIGGARVNHEIDRKLGIPERTGKSWRALPGFWDAIHAQVKQFLASQVGPISSKLAEDAAAGGEKVRGKAQELFFKLRGDLTDRVEHSGGVALVDLAALKPEDAPAKAELAALLLAAMRKKESI